MTMAEQEKKPDTVKKVETVLRHVRLVQDACILLGTRLIDAGEEDFGRILIANGLCHDSSKFFGVEWEYLTRDEKENETALFAAAYKQHVLTNSHHVEYWGNIDLMPRIRIAEMVCDMYARSSEFGTDLRRYIKESFTKKHGMTVQSRKYKEMKYFLDLLLDPPFA